MPAIWVYSEDVTITQQLLALGRNLADNMQTQLCAFTLNGESATSLIASGADKVVSLQGNSQWPESYAQSLADLAKQERPEAVFIGATQRGKDLAAKVAAIIKTGLVTEAFAVRIADGAIETDRIMYGGLAICTEILTAPAIVTIPARTYEAISPDPNRTGEIVTMDVKTDDRVSVSNVCPIIREGADISIADKLVCVGRGLAKQEDMRLVEDLAVALGAEIGCTRGIAEDYHWLPNDRYIGLSGQKIKPSLYISLGISGQVQHVSGIRDSKIIVAIDMNENAPIFEAADYGIVGDLYEISPLLTEAIKQAVK
ncbi:electron transfer flavoprotein subunit alpha/FixB family protein [Sporomusa acidovorans]|uniref:Protein FixB n=1 Tax=Sporomusa acidovorans (strain ATCC 49682 / DSM 3132 / Mol) TaxID=1123286 RepID=A0ABZ3J5Z0_SPOA4|nr:electron transfer flavoprotein subunit alpha/FixB family protein [Sporomusa acidovorans]OZC24309.1 acryloyl-CoA reductase electron transfer subunit beta [Sporomusa acidovorans DSM 3132]SDF02418.1 electron transfer flavoprotein alpha subunit apoprotein [Sporomusa acidovorans]